MRMNRPLALAAVSMVVAGLFLAAPDAGAAAPTATTPHTVAASTTPTPTADQITATGRVQNGPEAGCLVLLVPYGSTLLTRFYVTYALMGGDPHVLVPGSQVRVTGQIRTDLTSSCTQRHPLQVFSATRV